jgi:cobyrinic acid a,c-diamide synthase
VLSSIIASWVFSKISQSSGSLSIEGESINAHEFHYTKSDLDGDGFTAIKKSTGKERRCIIANDNVFAGYPHLHLWGNIDFAKNYIIICKNFSLL